MLVFSVAESQVPFVAFSAYATADHVYRADAPEAPLHPILLDEINGVHFNVGDAFSTETGQFTCPVSGYYAFEGQVHTYRYEQAGLVKCTEHIVKRY